MSTFLQDREKMRGVTFFKCIQFSQMMILSHFPLKLYLGGKMALNVIGCRIVIVIVRSTAQFGLRAVKKTKAIYLPRV